jgi:alpha-glucosidase
MEPMTGPTPGPTAQGDQPWWVDGVVYQIYPRSFADADGDGVGDLRGITSRLDHLVWLGIDAIWLSPITVSPNKDWGYDVADYCDVDPALGTLEDLDTLVAEAAARDIRIVLDLVPNHSSDQHPWFQDAKSSRDAAYRDWYVWADGDPPGTADGAVPNNWRSEFLDGPAWSFDEATGQWYLHHFVAEQPDLNWWNEDLRDEFDRILRFWFDRGIAGFRIDVCHMIVKDKELRNNPPVDFWTDHESERFDAERPEVHDVLRRWRRIAEEYDPPRLLLGETYVAGAGRLARFYGEGDELQLAFNFPFLKARFHAEPLARFVAETEAALPAGASPVWTGSNHDHSRFPTRWAQNDDRRTRLALLMLLTLRGTPVLYYGDEIGMGDTPITRSQLEDPVGVLHWPAVEGRDPERTPMQWHDGEGAGFTDPGVTPWLPIGDADVVNVAAQVDDPASILSFCRAVVALRRQREDLRRGDYRPLESPDGTWVFRRGRGTLVALNLSTVTQDVEVPEGEVLISTVPAGRPTGQAVGTGTGPVVTLAPWEGVVLASAEA